MIELFANRFYYSVYCSVVKYAHAMDFIARPLKWLFATFCKSSNNVKRY